MHCHTWYTHWGGILAQKNYGIPLVITVHSLEPLRPWKREQLGGGYDFSLWVEKTALEMADAVIAVSNETKADIAREAHRLGLDAGISHSCYDPAPDGGACGLCDACRLRAKGFAEAGIADPTAYV